MSDPLPHSVLFACTRNSVRSPMAESMLKELLRERLGANAEHIVYVDSVGLINGELDGFAVDVMREIGVDLSRHHPKRFQDRWDTSYDLLICLSPEAYEHGRQIARTAAMDVIYWETEDPTETQGNREQRLDAYRRVRDSLKKRLLDRFFPS